MLDHVQVNGWECDGNIGIIQTKGKKRDLMYIDTKGAEITSLEEIEDIKLSIYAYNRSTNTRESETLDFIFVVENGQLVRK